MHSLPIFVRLTGRRVILVGDGEAANAKRRLLERAGARICGVEADARLAVVAMDAPDETVATLKARGVMVNAVDRPDLCDFTLPAIVDRDPVLIAVGTGGASAGLAKALRQRLEALLPAGLGALASALFAARPRIRQRWPDAGERRRAIDAALGEGAVLDPLSGSTDVEAWLAEGDATAPPAFERLDLRSADPDDLTLRQARLLASADRIHHDPDVPDAILDRARADAIRTCAPPPSKPGPGLTLRVQMVGP